jgi:WD40 repeat protein
MKTRQPDFAFILFRLAAIGAFILLAATCGAPVAVSQPATQPAHPAAPAASPTSPEPKPTPKPAADWLPADLAPISAQNAAQVRLLAELPADIPPFYHFSADGSRLAVGHSDGIELYDTISGDLLQHIPATLPRCAYGSRRAFRLNADGSFIALLNGQNVEVWQAGGGKLYEAPYTSAISAGLPFCGAELPQLALSPDGRLLAQSGMDYSRKTVKRYFRVVHIPDNQTVYEWSGSNDDMHGDLYAFYGLGFSAEGALLQTFDARRFSYGSGEEYTAFRFWDAADWQEVDRADARVAAGFPAGSLRFTLSSEDRLRALSRVSGDLLSDFAMPGCRWDAPCEARFSPDGLTLLAASRAQPAALHMAGVLYDAAVRIQLPGGAAEPVALGLARDLESALPADGGQVLDAASITGSPTLPLWWTFDDAFSGLHASADGAPWFMPLAARTAAGPACPFCNACTLDLEGGTVTCTEGLPISATSRLFTRLQDGQVLLFRKQADGETPLGALSLPVEVNPANARVRLLGYAAAEDALFYCVDENARQYGCFIYNNASQSVLAAPADITGLRLAEAAGKAAFVDRSLNAMFIYDLASGKLTRKYPYQARAYPVNPLYNANQSRLLYVIQNPSNASDLSVETLDALTGKSYGRVSLRKAGVTQPTAFETSPDGALWFFADAQGNVSILGEKGVLIARIEAHNDAIIGMALHPSLRWLATLGADNTIRVWGIASSSPLP